MTARTHTHAAGGERSSIHIARNAMHLVAGQAATMVLGILFSAMLGRRLGAGDFGLYFLISSFSTFALVLVDWGQQYFGIREVAREPERMEGEPATSDRPNVRGAFRGYPRRMSAGAAEGE